MLRTHRTGKGLGGCGGWRLGSRNRSGPDVPPTPGLRGRGTSPGSPAGFLGSSGQGKCPPLLSCSSCFSCPRGPLPPASPVLPLSFFLCPQDQCTQGEEGNLEGRGLAWEFCRLHGLSGPGDFPLLLSHSFWRAPPTYFS